MATITLSTDDRLRLAALASNLKLSASVCYNPGKFYLPMKHDETVEQHNARLYEYREALVTRFNAIQAKIRARYTYRHSSFPR